MTRVEVDWRVNVSTVIALLAFLLSLIGIAVALDHRLTTLEVRLDYVSRTLDAHVGATPRP